MNLIALTRFLHSRWFVLTSLLMMIGGAWLAHLYCDINFVTGDRGAALLSPNLWFSDLDSAMWVNLAMLAVSGMLLTLMVKVFNLLRAVTTLATSMFFIMTLATPDLLVQFSNGTLACLVILACLFLLFSTYSDERRLTNIFLIFTVLSAMSMAQYSYMVYIPVFIIGCIQMRIFSLKTVLAIFMGLVTPWWIGYGCGLLNLENLHAPEIINGFTTFDLDDTLHLVTAAVVTLVVVVGAWMLNLMKMLSYNAHRRAASGALSVLSLVTILAIALDFTNASSYTPMLYMCASLQVSHLMAGPATRSGYIPILTLTLIYVSLYMWRMFI
jgi:hypothetical protein